MALLESAGESAVCEAGEALKQLAELYEALRHQQQQNRAQREKQRQERHVRRQQREQRQDQGQSQLQQRREQREQQRRELQEEEEEDEDEGAEDEAIATAFGGAKMLNKEPQDELSARVHALLLIITEAHCERSHDATEDIEGLLFVLQSFVRLYRTLPGLGPRQQVLWLQDNASEITSSYGRLNELDFWIRNLVGLVELGTGVRTVKEFSANVEEQQQALSPFAYPTRFFGSSEDAAFQISWMNEQPWNSLGLFADIYVGWHSVVGKVALKRLRRSDDPDEDTSLKKERDIWQRLQHPNVLPLLGTFEHDNHGYFVSPFMKNGSVADYSFNRSTSIATGDC